MPALKRVRSVGTERKPQLKQDFVGFPGPGVVGVPILSTHLAELAGPVCQYDRAALVRQVRKLGAVCVVKASAQEPAAAQLIVTPRVEAGRFFGGRLVSRIG